MLPHYKPIFDRMMKGERLTYDKTPKLHDTLGYFRNHGIKYSSSRISGARKTSEYFMSATDKAINKQLLKQKENVYKT